MKKPASRRGGALVELAIVLPILVLLVGATMDACDMIFLRNSLTAAAYSGTLQASERGSDGAEVQSKIQQSLTVSNVQGSSISISGPNNKTYDQSNYGDHIQITVSATVADNLRMGGFIQGKSNITVVATAVK